MYIQPNTDVIIFQGVPLDNTYTDTIYFTSVNEQYNFFVSNYTRKNFGSQSYQRVNKNRIRLQVLADTIATYNYMLFRNTAYGNKWFYAFITDINYINDNCTEIEYEIDVMQSWLFEVTLEPSYVEREHVAQDGPGQHLEAENTDLGRIICQYTEYTNLFDSYSVVIAMALESGSTSAIMTAEEGGDNNA